MNVERTSEAELLRQISRDNLWETNRKIAEWVRLSGSKEERTTFEYVKGLLDGYGLRTTLIEHPALVSYPLDATLQVISPDGQSKIYKCLSHAFGASVVNLDAPIVDVRKRRLGDNEEQEVAGRVVLLDGLAMPTLVYRFEKMGALGAIFINDDHLHNMIVSTVWGTPTPASSNRLPAIPVLSVMEADGRELREQIAGGPTNVRISTQVFRGWQTTPILVGEVEGKQSDEFVMFTGHLDSWHLGAMDNGSANATMLEVARLFAQVKDELYRGLRVVFWSGHSHGRYSGSTWYADHYWQELYDRCVAHVNIDSTGARGANYYGSFPAHMELGRFGASVIEEYTGQRSRPYRMTRAGDMSFNGIGIPSLFMELSQMRDAAPEEEEGSGSVVGGMPWWWHTDQDTMDKVNLDVLELDTKIYVSSLWRLCHPALLAMDFRPVVQELDTELSALERICGEALDLSELKKLTSELLLRVDKLSERAAAVKIEHEISPLNSKMKALSRILIPLTYTRAGRFDHDPAWDIPYLPGLQGVRELVNLDPSSDGYMFLLTELVRSRNAVQFALGQALQALASV